MTTSFRFLCSRDSTIVEKYESYTHRKIAFSSKGYIFFSLEAIFLYECMQKIFSEPLYRQIKPFCTPPRNLLSMSLMTSDVFPMLSKNFFLGSYNFCFFSRGILVFVQKSTSSIFFGDNFR